MTTTMVEEQTKAIPSITFLTLAGGSVALSAALMLSGKKQWANFVGQWAPTLLLLGIYNKIVKTFSPPYSESQRLRHGDNASILKSTSGIGTPQPTITHS